VEKARRAVASMDPSAEGTASLEAKAAVFLRQHGALL
jgi:hypothetical protein